ncbi:hypothetical protein [Croceicoccus sp. YJ47]|nr:hypothetical protein [Croceicoccus sp. YJ47]QQN74249.1 hypothetical protein JD971_00015 [Croceicoccus sp. YJ47]
METPNSVLFLTSLDGRRRSCCGATSTLGAEDGGLTRIPADIPKAI